MRKLNIFLLGAVLAIVSSCTYSFPEPETATSGEADFTKFVVIGNSLSAGFMDGALYNAGQTNSFANIIGQQMQLVGGGAFNQPDISSENGIVLQFSPAVLGRLVLKGELTPAGVVNPAPTPIGPGDPLTDYVGNKAELNNFAVSGMRIVYMGVAGYGTLNPYFGRFAADASTSSVLSDALAAQGTFFLFWLGGNDALGYATGGATGNPDGDGSTPGDMTSATVFDAAYKNYVAALITSNSKQGVLANVPDVNDIPFFTTVPWDAIPMDQATADATNSAYTSFNGGIDAYNAGQLPGQTEPPAVKRDKINFVAGQNGAVITDESLPDLTAYNIPSMRQATSSDLFTLSAGAVLGTEASPGDPSTTIGVGVPLAEQYTLTLADQEAIANRTADFNATIKSVVDASDGNLVLVDVNAIFKDFATNGVTINGAAMDASIFPPFGAFSLDGVHPNQRGSAYVASLFIDEINSAFGSNIPNINPNNYSGNALPVPK